jgi:hypothetical protein
MKVLVAGAVLSLALIWCGGAAHAQAAAGVSMAQVNSLGAAGAPGVDAERDNREALVAPVWSRMRPPVRYHIAPNGRDSWSGKSARPNAARTDGPFASLARARDVLREDKKAGAIPNGATVSVADGEYEMAAPLVFEAGDSGAPNAPIIYAGSGRAVFSGGRKISGWKVQGGHWQVLVPGVRESTWNFGQLWVNGARRNRPRFPKTGYSFIERALEPSSAEARGHDRFGFKAGDVDPNWANRADIDFLMMQVWTMARVKARDIDAATRAVTFTAPTRTRQWYGAYPRGHRFVVENVKEALGQPGEWYLDRPSGILTYIPLPGETPQKSVATAPRLSHLVEFRGGEDGKAPVSDIVLRGMQFHHTNFVTPPGGNTNIQAEADMKGAIRAVGAERIAIEDCVVSHVGEYAIDFGRACHANRIENCEMLDLAAGGVKIGTMQRFDDPQVLASRNIVRNNLIAHFGRMHPAGIGVWVGHSPWNVVAHNTIRDGYYTGISPGWSWGYGASGMHHNTLAYNHISLIGQGVLSDMGGIYTLGVTPGTTVHHNRIHDISSFDYGGWGIYFDEGTSQIRAANNLVYRTKSTSFHQHYGRDNVVENNIFYFGTEGMMQRSRDEEHLSFSVQRNIFVADEGSPLVKGAWNIGPERARLDRNVYWRLGKDPVDFAGKTLEQWRALGHDKNSVVADPLFVDVKKDNFALKPNSPALKLGFVPFDVSKAGRLDARGAVAKYLSVAPRAFPAPPPPPPPTPIAEGFEENAVGSAWQFTTSEDANVKAATARVSDEHASPFEPKGKQSLKFSDAPGQNASFNPHVHADPRFEKVALAGRFDLRRGEGAVLYHEWRDASSPYKVGPSLRVDADGSLRAGGRTLAQIPTGAWHKFEIAHTLGSGKWSLSLTDEAGRKQQFTDLTCDPKMTALRWWGFVSDARDASVFYIDNAQVGPVQAAK